MVENRPSCLIVCSSSKEGVCAQSFSHAFTLTNSTFNVTIATPQGLPMDFTSLDEKTKRWVLDFSTKPYSNPVKLESVDPTKYSALLYPSCPGNLRDLLGHDSVMHVTRHFVREKKPVCAIGYGCVALCSGKLPDSNEWCFRNFSMTGPTVIEMLKRKDFPQLPVVFEDFAKMNMASFTASTPDSAHIVIDRNLITAQNSQSTLQAVQNLILACNNRM